MTGLLTLLRARNSAITIDDPTDLSGLSAWLDASNAENVVYDGADYASAWSPSYGSMSLIQDIAMYQPLYSYSGAKKFLIFDPVANHYMFTSSTWSDLITSSAATVFVAWQPLGTLLDLDTLTPYSNDLLLGDDATGGYAGIHAYDDGAGAAVTQAYNWDGTADAASISSGFDQWQIATMRHGAGAIGATLNKGAESTTASGATSSLSGALSVCGTPSLAKHTGCYLGEIVIYNRSLSAAERLAVQTYLYDKWVAA